MFDLPGVPGNSVEGTVLERKSFSDWGSACLPESCAAAIHEVWTDRY